MFTLIKSNMDGRFTRAFELLSRIKAVVYDVLPEGTGVYDENNKTPAQLEFTCLSETVEGLRCVASFFTSADGKKVIFYHPYADSGSCCVCESIGCSDSLQKDMKNLLEFAINTASEIRQMTSDDEEVCSKTEQLRCPACAGEITAKKPDLRLVN